MSCAVPIGPLMPRSGYRSINDAQPRQRKKHLLGRRREPLTQRGGLRGDVVAAARHRQVAVADRLLGQPRHHRNPVREDEFQRPADLQLLNVFGEVTARHALVHVLVARERVELLDAGLDVVAQHPFPRGDRGQVDVVEHPLVVGKNAVGHDAPSTPNSACARSTASHSRRSATTLASGDQIATISSLAYRLASTLGIVTDTQLTARVRQARPYVLRWARSCLGREKPHRRRGCRFRRPAVARRHCAG